MSASLRAGFGRRDLTPHERFPNGIWMAQRHARAEGIHRRLYVNCLAVGDGADAVAILSYDLTILSARQVDAIQAAVRDRTGLDAERVWLYVSHNHAGPVTQDFYDREGADEVKAYVERIISASAEAAEEARRSMRPARAAAASGHCTIGVNRDLLLAGRMVTGPNPQGFADPTVDVLRVDDLDGRPIAAVVTYGCHPTFLGPDNKLVSPDYPGVMRDFFESQAGAPCVFLQAGGGNVGPLRGFRGDTEEVEREGKILGCEAVKTFLSIDTRHRRPSVESVIESGAPLGVVTDRQDEPSLRGFDCMSRAVALPTDHPGPTVYDTVEDDLDKAGAEVDRLQSEGAPMPQVQAAIQRRLRHQLRLDRKRMYFERSHFDVRVRALLLDDVAFLSVACEAFAEIAVAVREASPFRNTVFAAYEGPDVIYVAPAKYFADAASMEVFNSPFGPAAAERLIVSATQMLGELNDRSVRAT